mmetsp:Transcript_8822/g.12541  ORF Transcript_8822/g.12541 Transcript_8822/m.12541 type:complete len:220 (+) Transcript_8822:721-1380(+)
MAPAPSPNKIHELRSSQSIHRLNASAPTTIAFLYPFPLLLKNCPAVTLPNKKPEHAAVRSKATALVQSNAAAMDVASPKRSSAEDVATSTKSISDGSRPDISSADRAASVPSVRMVSISVSESPSSSEEEGFSRSKVSTWRWDMPVRVRIQSSEVSTTDSRSWFVIMVLGAADPIPMARQFIFPVVTMESFDEDEVGEDDLLVLKEGMGVKEVDDGMDV